jgi:hypothetical protein
MAYILIVRINTVVTMQLPFWTLYYYKCTFMRHIVWILYPTHIYVTFHALISPVNNHALLLVTRSLLRNNATNKNHRIFVQKSFSETVNPEKLQQNNL